MGAKTSGESAEVDKEPIWLGEREIAPSLERRSPDTGEHSLSHVMKSRGCYLIAGYNRSWEVHYSTSPCPLHPSTDVTVGLMQ